MRPRQRRSSLALLFALANLASGGCTYLAARARDLRDVVTFDFGVGFGLGVDGQLTDAFHTGLGGGQYFVWQLGHPSHAASDSALGGLQANLAWLVYRTDGSMLAPDHQGFLLNFTQWPAWFAEPPHGRDALLRTTSLPLSQHATAPWWNVADIDVGVQLLPVSCRLGARPGELVDFLLGWFGADVLGDDDGPPPRHWLDDALTQCNPALPLTTAEALADLERMRGTPRPLQRPVFVLGGLLDGGLVSLWAQDLRRLVPAEQAAWVIPVTFATALSFEAAATTLHAAVAAARTRLSWQGPVDVVAHSMGGLVARFAASTDGELRLPVERLFTVGTPHRGARLAVLPAVHPLARGLRADGAFVRDLPSPTFPIVPYVLAPDGFVGADNAAPPGELPWWLPCQPGRAAHIGALADPRLLADIARSLRAEVPFRREPRTPPPR
jgi:hypothetical protein